MRIGCLQFAPQVGDLDNNLNRADAVLSKADIDDLDLLVLPELAFTGYNFKSLQEITPFLEYSGSGITSLWARTVALKYNCVVTVGYPEKVDPVVKWPTSPEYYNSAIVVNGDGETIANYRKSFLYYTDETWALEGGRGFYDGFIPGLGNTSIGICMDLNPYKFEAPWSAFEFGFHILECQSNLVIVSMAWLTREDQRNFSRMPDVPDMESLTYWVTRLDPLIRNNSEDEVIVVFCNRTGIEGDAMYAGTSAVVGIHEGEVRVYGLLGRGQKDLLVVDTNDAPYAKLVYRPQFNEFGSSMTGCLQREDHPDQSGPGGSNARDGSRTEQSNSIPEGRESSSGQGSKSSTSRAPEVSPKKQAAYSKPAPINTQRRDVADGVPTPSAPSPTPMAVRPKLIIPTSPSSMSFPVSAENPNSAISQHSQRSIQSVKSEDSVQTVRSNPRPPEESTPYPHSGAPPSGYPANEWSRNFQIYGGEVQVAYGDEAFTPVTPFEDTSPISANPFWHPSDSPFSFHQGASRTGGTPIVGTQPQPFPWEVFRSSGPSRNGTRAGATDSPTIPATPAAIAHLRSRTPQSGAASRKQTPVSSSVAQSTGTGGEVFPDRPPSPKSRNASRSRMNDRSDSAMSQRERTATVPQHLENVSRRAESVDRMRRASSQTPGGIPIRTLSRNSTASRPTTAFELDEDVHAIPIMASPSILEQGHTFGTFNGIGGMRSSPRPSQRRRRTSSIPACSDVDRAAGHGAAGPSSERATSLVLQRTMSRGRQPGPVPGHESAISQKSPKDNVPTEERASSKDSIRNEVLHSRKARHSSSRGYGPPGENTPDHGRGSAARRRPSVDQHGNPFERVEEVVCPNCPLHGRRTSITPGEAGHSHGTETAADNTPAAPAGAVTASQPSPKPTTEQMQASGDSVKTPVATTQTAAVPDDSAEAAALERTTSQDYSSSAETTLTVSTPGRSPATPSFFDPLTPKAMVFSFEEDLPGEAANEEDIGKLPGLEHVTPAKPESPPVTVA